MTTPALREFSSLAALALGCSAGLVAACASMGDRAYRASSLQLFVASRPTRLEAGGTMLVAGRLVNRDEVLRVLGPRSGKLFADGIVVQANVSAGARAIRLHPGSFALRLDSGEELQPATPEQVLAAVSLPASEWTGNQEMPFENPAAPHLPGERRSPPLGGGELSAFMALTITSIDAAVVRAGAAQYRREARADVVAKTTVPSEIRPGESHDLLLVFVPASRQGSVPVLLGLHVTFEVAGQRVDRTLALE